MPTAYSAALYLRLSKDDDDAKFESASIQAQRKMLTSYADNHGFSIHDYYVDDGYSGTNFDRPDFKRMLSDIETGIVNLVIVKDLSRLGRDYITTGQYTEIIFPAKGVRCIAVNDGYDSINPNNDIVPFKNVLNEMYARDISMKIRSAFTVRMNDGAFIGNFAPYGYMKEQDNKHHLVPDPNTAPIVQHIFSMAAQGIKYSEIARYLNEQGIIPPILYRCTNNNIPIDRYNAKRLEWTSGSIGKLCKNTVYLGHTSQGKTSKVSFKSKTSIAREKNDWIVVRNTHQPIIDQETFSIAQRISKSRTCQKNKNGFSNVFSGLAVCADCGCCMSTVGSRKKNSPYSLACGKYKLYSSSACTNHFIDYNTLYNLVLNAINEKIAMTQSERNALFAELQKADSIDSEKAIAKRELKSLSKRQKEIDILVEKLYEDKVKGLLSESRFLKLLESFETENNDIKHKIDIIENSSKQNNTAKEAYIRFDKLISQYDKINELTPDLLFKLIERIEIGQGHYEKTESGKVKNQTIRIYFRFHMQPETKNYDM